MKKKKERSLGIGSWLILMLAIAVFCYSGYQLISVMNDYRSSNNEYETIADEFTKPADEEAESEEEAEQTTTPSESAVEIIGDEIVPIEVPQVPIDVDWDNLKAINSDIVGWIYVNAQPTINYPVLHGDSNDTYLHTTFRKEYRYAGSIFIDTQNNGKWNEPNTIVYGHNMRNGSMFGMLKHMMNQESIDADPYFWILTPNGNYCYYIYAAFETNVNSEVYTLFSQGGPEFLAWEERMKSASRVKNNVQLAEDDKTVILSTCTSNSSTRNVIIGKRIN